MDQDILQKYIEGNATQHEKEAVSKWLDDNPQNMQDFLKQRRLHDITLWNQEDLSIQDTEQETSSESNKPKRFKLVQELLKVAAIFLVALGCYHLFMKDFSASNIALQSIYSPEGQRTELTLSDGTKVWLNAKSKLVFPNHFGTDDRIVELDGEAYFDVTHDDKKKFIVKTARYNVKVHGTEFNVSAYSQNNYFETALIKGSVELLSNTTDERMMLSPNNKAYFKDNSLVQTEVGSMDQFLWKQGILYVENMKVRDLFEKLELYYDVKIIVKNQDILEHQYTGKFRTKDGIDHLLKVLQLRHNFKYKKESIQDQEHTNTIIIY